MWFSTYHFGQYILFIWIMLSCDMFGGYPCCGGKYCPGSTTTLKMQTVWSTQSIVPIALLLIKHQIFYKQIYQFNINLHKSKTSFHMKNLLWLRHQHILLRFTRQIKTFIRQTFLYKQNCTNATHLYFILTIHIAYQAYKILSIVQSNSFNFALGIVAVTGFANRCRFSKQWSCHTWGYHTRNTLLCTACTYITYHLVLNVCGIIKICGGGLYVWELRYLLWRLWRSLPSGMMTDSFEGMYQSQDKLI